jgi:hypothetical protein
MNADCRRGSEVLELVRAGRWPESCDDDVRAHVAACTHCEESVRIATIMTADFRAAVRTAQVPTSGVVWWRAQRRAREEAAQAAARAVTLVQAISVAVGLTVAIGIAGAVLAVDGRSGGAGWSDLLRRALTFAPSQLLSATTLSQWTVPLLIAFAAWLAIAPVAVYLAVSRD